MSGTGTHGTTWVHTQVCEGQLVLTQHVWSYAHRWVKVNLVVEGAKPTACNTVFIGGLPFDIEEVPFPLPAHVCHLWKHLLLMQAAAIYAGHHVSCAGICPERSAIFGGHSGTVAEKTSFFVAILACML
eukprot:1462810-Rhodomonas_salina.2